MKPALILICLTVSAALSGCTSRQLYNAGQGWQRNECNKLLDQGERERCLREANTTYDDYKRQTEGSK